MKNVLIVSGHADIKNGSAANKEILAQLAERLPEAAIDSLCELYPDYRFDVSAEQAKLVAADVVVLQFPVFWYALPSLLQKWVEDVFQHGFSHGSTGDKLHGKKLVVSLTTGAPAEMYAHDGAMGHTIEEFFYSAEATAALTGMEFAGYVYTGGVSYQARETEEGAAEIKAKAADHADRLVKLLETL